MLHIVGLCQAPPQWRQTSRAAIFSVSAWQWKWRWMTFNFLSQKGKFVNHIQLQIVYLSVGLRRQEIGELDEHDNLIISSQVIPVFAGKCSTNTLMESELHMALYTIIYNFVAYSLVFIGTVYLEHTIEGYTGCTYTYNSIVLYYQLWFAWHWSVSAAAIIALVHKGWFSLQQNFVQL